jgi:phosphoenolpyruvate carboxykinase (ATP)
MSIEVLEDRLREIGLININDIRWDLSTAQLYEEAIRRREGFFAHLGPLVTRTGSFTGRAPNDKYIVDSPGHRENIWWGNVNHAFSEEAFDRLYKKVCVFLQGKDLFVQDLLAGADSSSELPIRVITQMAWHSLFSRNMFIRPSNLGRSLGIDEPRFTVLHAPHFHAQPTIDGTNSEAFIIINFARKIVLIGGTQYAGEIKKSIFSVMNFLLPQNSILSMHASANVGEEGDVAVFFGLSGTGKTTLSTDPQRRLIGDDEHGWGGNGVFNLEGGCYAKVIHLSQEKEPLIYETTRRFGTVIENVGIDFHHRLLDLDDDSLTENTRACYPVTHIPGAIYPGIAGHPGSIVMLTCDAFGVMPPIAKLDVNQAMYYFLSGYTAKVAGTEAGIVEPQVTFSACFGAPFMTLHPSVYDGLLGNKIRKHNVDCWLVNTGWSGGPYGIGERIDINHTRTMLKAALSGALNNVAMREDPVFRLQVPESCPGIADEVLHPESTWPDKALYKARAQELALAFRKNFKQFDDMVSNDVKNAGPATEFY